MQTEISVIVPVYNVEKFLPHCIESILNQTFENFELILVDDGSPDRCGEICDEAAKHDARVHVIHQKNAGLSAARNAGIEVAKGEWLSFIDSDDFVAPEFLQMLYAAVMQESADCAICNFCYTNEKGVPINTPKRTQVEDEILSGEHILEDIAKVQYLIVMNKLYKKTIFRELRFPQGKVHEDVFVFAAIFSKVKKAVCVSAQQYFYCQREGSITHEKTSLNRLDETRAFIACYTYFETHEMTRFMPIAEKRVFTSMIRNYYNLPRKMRHSHEMKEIKNIQWNMILQLGKMGILSYRALLRTLFFRAMPHLYALRLK